MDACLTYETDSGGATTASADILLLRAITAREELLARLPGAETVAGVGGGLAGTLAAFRGASIECVERMCQRQLVCGVVEYRWRQHPSYMYKMGRDVAATLAGDARGTATIAALRSRHCVGTVGQRNPLLLPNYPPPRGSAAEALEHGRGGLFEGGLDWKRVERATKMVEFVAKGPRPPKLSGEMAVPGAGGTAAEVAAAAAARRRQAAVAARQGEAEEEARALRSEARQARAEHLAARVELGCAALCARLEAAASATKAKAKAKVKPKTPLHAAAVAAAPPPEGRAAAAAAPPVTKQQAAVLVDGAAVGARKQQRPQTAPPARSSMEKDRQQQQQRRGMLPCALGAGHAAAATTTAAAHGASARPQTASAAGRSRIRNTKIVRKASKWDDDAGFLAWSFGVIEHSAGQRRRRQGNTQGSR